ncbi:MAG TPA: hypothetical protein VJA64_00390 [Desulfobaccales bacterium]|nr:hypothetical protein [Desulfobaccales bacterium]
MQTDDRAVTGGSYEFNSFIFIKFIINCLNFFQSAAGVFISEQNNSLHIAQLFSGRRFKRNLKGDGIILGDRFGVLKHLGDHITGYPVMRLHQKFLGVSQILNFRAQTRKEPVNFPRHSILKEFDYGPGIKATMMLLHPIICPCSPGNLLQPACAGQGLLALPLVDRAGQGRRRKKNLPERRSVLLAAYLHIPGPGVR